METLEARRVLEESLDTVRTRQDIFETAARHLLTQGCKSWRILRLASKTQKEFAYRGDNGNMCPLGALISDEDYQESMEGQTVESSADIVLACGGTTFDIKFLDGLRHIHDAHLALNWRAELYLFGRKWELDTEFLNPAA